MRFSNSKAILSNLLPKQEQLNKTKSQYLLPKIFSNPVRHYEYPNEAFAFGYEYFRAIGHKPDTARKHLEEAGLIEFGKIYDRRKYCQPAYPTQKFYDVGEELAEHRFERWHVNPRWRPTNKEPAHCPTKPRKITSVDGIRIEQTPTIDMDCLSDFIADGFRWCKQKNGEPVPDPLLWRNYALRVREDATSLNGKYGRVCFKFNRYPDPATHRIMSDGLGAQNCHRHLREALFNGYNSADISNCFYSLLAQRGHYPAIQSYAENPGVVRKEIAKEICTTPEAVKAGLLATLNGANLNPFDGNALVSIFGVRELAQNFWNHPTVRAIRKDSCNARKAEGFGRKSGPWACWLMSEEQRCARAMQKACTVSLPLHDGIMTREALDAEELQERIQKETGYFTQIKITKVKYAIREEKGGRH